MKKVVRTVWISMLTGLAFLVACTCHNKLSKSERKQLKHERDSITANIHPESQASLKDDPRAFLRAKQQECSSWERIYEIDTLLGDEQAANISKSNVDALKRQIEDLKQFTPVTVYGPPPANPNRILRFEKRKNELEQRLQLLIEAINEKEGAEVYGSPEIIEEHRQEIDELRKEATDVERELLQLNKDLDRMKKTKP